MKVFISWSGKRSKAVADILNEWLPCILQAVEPWLSSEDIQKGTRWSIEIAQQLEKIQAGIICVTPENQNSAWLMFEAGALSKTLDQAYVCPFLFGGLDATDIEGPLAQFQVTTANKDDIKRLVTTINLALEDQKLTESRLANVFEKWWPDLEKKLASVPPIATTRPAKRSDREILEEILTATRTMSRALKDSSSDLTWRTSRIDELVESDVIARLAVLNETDRKRVWSVLREYLADARMNKSKSLGETFTSIETK